MADFWIILGYTRGKHPHKHRTLDAAQIERERLAGIDPAKTFTIFRCKTHTATGPRYEQMRALLSEIAPERLAEIEGVHDHDLEREVA